MIKNTFLLELRNNQGISQAFVAEKIGVSRASYIEIEKGAKELTLSQANKIAEIFNVSLAELLSGEKISDIRKMNLEKKKNRKSVLIYRKKISRNLKRYYSIF